MNLALFSLFQFLPLRWCDGQLYWKRSDRDEKGWGKEILLIYIPDTPPTPRLGTATGTQKGWYKTTGKEALAPFQDSGQFSECIWDWTSRIANGYWPLVYFFFNKYTINNHIPYLILFPFKSSMILKNTLSKVSHLQRNMLYFIVFWKWKIG